MNNVDHVSDETDSVPDPNDCLYIGVDVHRYTHTALASNRFEEKISEITFDNNHHGINSFLSWINGLDESKKTRIIGIEGSNGYGRTLSDFLGQEYRHVYEINPMLTRQRRAFGTKGDKSDPIDAGLITQVLTRGFDKLPRVTVQDRSDNLTALEEFVRLQSDLTKESTRLKNQLRRIFFKADPDWTAGRKKAFGNKSLAYWKTKLMKLSRSKDEIGMAVSFSANVKISQLTAINTKRDVVEKKLSNILNQIGCKLTTLSGVGITTAANIITATKGIERFGSSDKFISYAGIAPSQRSSGKTRRFVQNKKGNRRLNNAIYTIALIQLRCVDKAKEYFQKKVSEGKTKKHAMRCLMKRMASIVYGMMKSGEEFKTNL